MQKKIIILITVVWWKQDYLGCPSGPGVSIHLWSGSDVDFDTWAI